MNTFLYLISVHRALLSICVLGVHPHHARHIDPYKTFIYPLDSVSMRVFFSTKNAALYLSRKKSNQALLSGHNKIRDMKYKCLPRGNYYSWLIGTWHANHSQDAHHRQEDKDNTLACREMLNNTQAHRNGQFTCKANSIPIMHSTHTTHSTRHKSHPISSMLIEGKDG